MKIRFYDNTAAKFIEKQPPKQQQRILSALKRLPVGDVKPLRGPDSFMRLRVGDYRIVFFMDEDTVIVRNVGNRGDVYKG